MPNELECLKMKCPECDGEGCVECEKKGYLEINCCPLEYVTRDICELIEYAKLYEKGLPPVAGGALDQTKYFIEACKLIFHDMNFWKAKLGIING